ncbi:MAG: hypothetical protein SFY67_14705 [Candidatus Melainabacteria bacterium]|nr:hypothetical protein [Candidatus Melainabacteria bacterium]
MKNTLRKVSKIYIFCLLAIVCHPQKAYAEDWSIQVYEALHPLHELSAPGANNGVEVVMKSTPAGKLELCAIGSKAEPMPEAVKLVANGVRKIQVPPPFPLKKYVWFTVFFKNGKFQNIGGPFALDSIEENLQYSVGMKQKPYERLMEDRIPASDPKKYPMSSTMVTTVSHVKISPKGTIEKISISAPNADAQKFVYGLIGGSQPFPPLPANYAKSPNFDIHVMWNHSDMGGMCRVAVKHVK